MNESKKWKVQLKEVTCGASGWFPQNFSLCIKLKDRWKLTEATMKFPCALLGQRKSDLYTESTGK